MKNLISRSLSKRLSWAFTCYFLGMTGAVAADENSCIAKVGQTVKSFAAQCPTSSWGEGAVADLVSQGEERAKTNNVLFLHTERIEIYRNEYWGMVVNDETDPKIIVLGQGKTISLFGIVGVDCAKLSGRWLEGEINYAAVNIYELSARVPKNVVDASVDVVCQ